MLTPEDQDRLLAYLDGTLPADECAVLEARLIVDSTLADELVLLAREDAVLTEWARSVGASTPVEPVAAPTVTLPFPSTPRRRWSPVARWGALAASLALMASGVLWLTSTRTLPANELVIVEQIRGEVLGTTGGDEPFLLCDGAALRPGQVIRTGGEDSFAVLRYPDNTRLSLAADTMVRLLTSEGGHNPGNHRVFVQEGQLVAEVARPMVLGTPHGEVVAAAGRFSCSSAALATRVEAEEGQIRFIRASDRAPLDIEVGYYAIAADREEQFVLRRRPEPATTPQTTLVEGSGSLLALAYHPAGHTLVTGGTTGMLKWWDTGTGAVRQALPAHNGLIRHVEFSHDGKWLLTSGNDRRPKIFDAETGQEKLALRLHRTPVEDAGFSPDDRFLATLFANTKDWGEVRFWHPATGAELGVLRVLGTQLLSLAFSDDGGMLALGCRDGSVRLCRLTTTAATVVAHEERKLTGHSGDVKSVEWKGDLIASAGVDGTARVRRASDGREMHVLTGHAREVRSVAFSFDGRYLATASNDSTARVWRLSDGREMFTAKDRKHAVTRALLAPDGKTLATASGDRTVKLWTLEQEAHAGFRLENWLVRR